MKSHNFTNPDIQSPDSVALRILGLSAIILRSNFEKLIQNIPEKANDVERAKLYEAHEIQIEKLIDWLHEQDIWNSIPPSEKDLWEISLGNWPPNFILSINYQAEAMGTLLWSINSIDDIPPFDTKFDSKSLFSHVKLLNNVNDFLQDVTIRSVEEIDSLRDKSELWYWRSNVAEQYNSGYFADLNEFNRYIRETIDIALANGDILSTINGDFPVHNKAYVNLTDEELLEMSAIASIRLFALNWLCGYSDNWDDTSLEI